MDSILLALRQPEYVHVLLNHFPVIGLFVAWLLLLVAVVKNSQGLLLIAVGMVGLLAFMAWPVGHYGELGYDRVLSMSDEAGGDYLKYHKELAEHWIFLFYATAILAVATLAFGWKKPRHLRWGACAVVVLAVASLIAGGLIAESGGKIRHREFRYGPPPPHLPSDD
jgi:hypothetical protein